MSLRVEGVGIAFRNQNVSLYFSLLSCFFVLFVCFFFQSNHVTGKWSDKEKDVFRTSQFQWGLCAPPGPLQWAS